MFDNSEAKYFGDELQGLYEAAPVLTAKYNELSRRYSKYTEITEEEMAYLLQTYVDAKEFNSMMVNEFTQGILIGRILTLHDVELHLEQEDEED